MKPQNIPMYQVNVTTKDGRQIPVGPRYSEKNAPEHLAYVINKAVAEKKEQDWRDARVVTITPILH